MMGLALALGLLTGAQSALRDPFPWHLVVALAIALAVFAGFLPSAARMAVACAIIGLLIGAGIASQRTTTPALLPDVLPRMIWVRVTSDPDVSARGYTALGVWRDDVGNEHETLVFLPVFPEPQRDMRLEAHGEFADAAGGLFYAHAARVQETPGWLEHQRHRLRRAMERALVRHTGGAPSALALGLLTGDDSAMTAARTDDLRAAGLSHLTAVSGWNVALVATAAAVLLGPLPLPRRATWLLQSLVIVAFVWLVGADPPVLRAGIMAQTALLARWYGRPAHTVSALLLAAAIMAVESPAALHSVSFRLSVAATAAMIVAAEITRRGPAWRLRALREASLTSGLAGIATAPILAAYSGTFALWTVPANITVAPLVPVATIVAVATCALAQIPLIGAPLADLCGTASFAIGSLILRTAELFARLPGATQDTSRLSRGLLAVVVASLMAAFALTSPEGGWVRRELRRSGAAFTSEGSLLVGSAIGVLLLGVLAAIVV